MGEGSSDKKEFSITYRFRFENGTEKVFNVNIHSRSLNIIRPQREDYPEWAKYKNFRCPHCPVNAQEDEFCPVAVNLEEIIRFFSNTASYEKITLSVETKERTFIKETSVQSGVSGIIGILMVTSGCPVMGKLKPMVRYHIPFATLEETEFRATSMYLLAQFFRKKWGLEPDWEMKKLINIYENIRILNQNVCRRIADVEAKDASINSLVILNNFADYVTLSLDDDMMNDLEALFVEYLDN